MATPRPRKRTPARKPRRRPRASARRRQRGVPRWVLFLAIIALVGFGAYTGAYNWPADVPEDPAQGAPSVLRGEVDPDRARTRLAELAVAEWGSMRGYSRDQFPHWRTVDGCNVRQTVLQRDGEDLELQEDGCRVETGSWYSPFDEVTLTDPADIDIDHLVPLANAWRTGASGWDDDRRAEFANDLDTPQLIAVSASSNRAKGDQDPSQWKPDRSYWCQYAHDWVVVKHYWELSVTEEEHEALADMLDTCD